MLKYKCNQVVSELGAKIKWYVLGQRLHYPVENGITFIHHYPEQGNLGDNLCSPRHYFEFKSPSRFLCIIGGGVYLQFAVSLSRELGLFRNRSVLWGVGHSAIDLDSPLECITSLPYRDWGIRDIDLVEGPEKHLPCVSCLHPMLDAPCGDGGTLLFINADEKVSGGTAGSRLAELARSNNWTLVYNNCSEEAFIKAFMKCDRVVTNSYHGSYWALLSGRAVYIVGCSTKLRSLLYGFGFGLDKLHRFKRGCIDSLIAAISEVDEGSEFIRLDQSTRVLSEFREKNRAFACRLKDAGLFKGFSMKKDSRFSSH